MFSLTNPTVFIGVMLALTLSFVQGTQYEKAKQDARIAQLNQQAQEQREKADADLYKQKQSFESKIRSINSGIDDGSKRLFINVKTPVCNSTTATGDGETRAELDGQTSKDIVAIAADGDKAIIDLNSCIDRYNSLKELK